MDYSQQQSVDYSQQQSVDYSQLQSVDYSQQQSVDTSDQSGEGPSAQDQKQVPSNDAKSAKLFSSPEDDPTIRDERKSGSDPTDPKTPIPRPEKLATAESTLTTESTEDKERALALGFSGEVSAILPTSGGGPGTFGLNFELIISGSDFKIGLYEYNTPLKSESVGFAVGGSLQGNAAIGSYAPGSVAWTGLFDAVGGSAGPFAAGYFQSGGLQPGEAPEHRGVSGGVGAGPPGIGATTENYGSPAETVGA